MPAYVVAMMSIHDPETYRRYTDQTPALIQRHGGRFLTRGGPVSCPEGDAYEGRMVMLEFPSKRKVDDWLADPDYQAASEYRRASSTLHYLLVQESETTPDAGS